MEDLRTKLQIPVRIVITFILYYLAAKMGLNLATINNQASPVWPATGNALSAMIFFGPSALVGIFLGALLVNFIITYIELMLENKKALGFNISSEKNRRDAIGHASETGLPAITKPAHLIQDQTRPGFLIFLPVQKY